eukprot:gb/GEZN01007879.1/.p1 GENE.gb/GEZN01007879.1/~~gb/GEZN01007879.1/.p1  ORF type:complete len:419 (+),score=31.37 gb/GEZN01007879.1/:161-1417(+)
MLLLFLLHWAFFFMGAAADASRLVVGGLEGWIEFDVETGDYVGVFIPSSPNSTVSSNRLWGTDSLLQREDGSLLVPTYYGDPNSAFSGPGSILQVSREGFIQRRWDGPAGREGKDFRLRRPYGLAMVPSALGSASERLVVAGLGNNALGLFEPDTGVFLEWLVEGDNTSQSTQGPNDVLLYGQNTIFVTTEGSTSSSDNFIVFPSYLESALLSVNLDTGKSTLVDIPSAAPGSAGFVSLLGLAYVPSSTFSSSYTLETDANKAKKGKEPRGRKDGRNIVDNGVLLVVSDFAGGLRYYDPNTHELLHTIDTTFFNPETGMNTTFFYGHVRAHEKYLYLSAYDYTAPTLSGYILRYTLDGQPAGLVDNTPIYIGPSEKISRAIGVDFIVGNTLRNAKGQQHAPHWPLPLLDRSQSGRAVE